MKITIKSLHFDADQKLLDFIQKKFSKLEKLWEDAYSADVTLKVNNDSTDANKIVDVRINVPGTDIFASRQGHTFEETIDGLVDILSRQLTKAKEKIRGK